MKPKLVTNTDWYSPCVGNLAVNGEENVTDTHSDVRSVPL